jgi:hypothetical protein
MTDFVTAFAVAGQAINLIKELRGVDKALSEAEFKVKIADLNIAVSELKNALVDAKDEVKLKDEEIARLNKMFVKIKDTVELSGYLYDKNEEGKPHGYAYCAVCLQKHGFMFHLVTLPIGIGGQCPNCKSAFNGLRPYHAPL